jgi:aspartate aminotransferase-like enzyme
VQEEHKGNVLVLVRVKDDWNAKVIHDVLDERGYIVATGFNENKTKMLRVGVIGEVKKEDIDASLPVIVSGKIDYIILKNLGKNEDWLLKELSKKGYTLNKILGACIINNKLDIVKSINNNGK